MDRMLHLRERHLVGIFARSQQTFEPEIQGASNPEAGNWGTNPNS